MPGDAASAQKKFKKKCHTQKKIRRTFARHTPLVKIREGRARVRLSPALPPRLCRVPLLTPRRSAA